MKPLVDMETWELESLRQAVVDEAREKNAKALAIGAWNMRPE